MTSHVLEMQIEKDLLMHDQKILVCPYDETHLIS